MSGSERTDHEKNSHARDVTQWVAVEDSKPNNCESLVGIEMPYESRYACHREDEIYVSDETGDSVAITHWVYALDPPF